MTSDLTVAASSLLSVTDRPADGSTSFGGAAVTAAAAATILTELEALTLTELEALALTDADDFKLSARGSGGSSRFGLAKRLVRGTSFSCGGLPRAS